METNDRAPAREGGAEVVRLRPLRALVVSRDDLFRAVTAMLLARRDCVTTSLAGAGQVGRLLEAGRVDVAVVDGVSLLREVTEEIARALPLAVPLAAVLALGEGEAAPEGIVTVAKWAPFDCIFAAVERADRRRSRRRPADAALRLSVIAADGRS